MEKSIVGTTDVVLYRSSHTSSELKTFLHFLSYIGQKKPYSFSYVESEGSLIDSLSLANNIMLDSIPCSLGKTLVCGLEETVRKTENPHLLKLFQGIDNLRVLPSQCSKSTCKIVSFIKGILKETPFLFLDKPEKYLNTEQIDLILKTVEYQKKSRKQLIVVCPCDENRWFPMTNHLLTRDNEGNFHLASSINNRNQDKILDSKNESAEGYLKFIGKGFGANKAA